MAASTLCADTNMTHSMTVHSANTLQQHKCDTQHDSPLGQHSAMTHSTTAHCATIYAVDTSRHSLLHTCKHDMQHDYLCHHHQQTLHNDTAMIQGSHCVPHKHTLAMTQTQHSACWETWSLFEPVRAQRALGERIVQQEVGLSYHLLLSTHKGAGQPSTHVTRPQQRPESSVVTIIYSHQARK